MNSAGAGTVMTAGTLTLAGGITLVGPPPMAIRVYNPAGPNMDNYSPLHLTAGDTGTITSSLLLAIDTVGAGGTLQYTLSSSPSLGTLLVNGLAASSFTQDDINNNRVTYRETTSVSSSTYDSFSFKLSDGAGNVTSPLFFEVDINPERTAPTLGNDGLLSLFAGDSATITSSLLSATDNLSSGADLHYTVSSGPSLGVLLLDGMATSSFTQADIDNNRVTYHETVGASGATNDMFLFKVTDAAGNATGTAAFAINIGPVSGNPPFSSNSDGCSDILWHNADGAVGIWEMNASGVHADTEPGTSAAPWQIMDAGDFNGDGRADLLWWNAGSGQLGIWGMNADGTTHVDTNPGSSAMSWHLLGVGDFNGDGRSDLLWRNDSGAVGIWQMIDGTQHLDTSPGTSDSSWKIVGVGDFNGDHVSDILWLNTSGQIGVWQMNGNATTHTDYSLGYLGTSWHFAGVGDFNGDGRADILWANDNGALGISFMNANGAHAETTLDGWGPSWHIAGTDDYNGDGKADILWRNDSGAVGIWFMNGTSHTDVSPGTSAPAWQIVDHHFETM